MLGLNKSVEMESCRDYLTLLKKKGSQKGQSVCFLIFITVLVLNLIFICKSLV